MSASERARDLARRALAGLLGSVLAACAAVGSTPPDPLAECSIRLDREPVSADTLRDVIGRRFAAKAPGFIAVRAACGVSDAELQVLLARLWTSGTPDIVLQRCAAPGQLDFDILVVPEVETSRCELGSTTSIITPASFVFGTYTGRYVLLRRPADAPAAP